MFHHRGNNVLKGATINDNNMLPMGSIFFAFKEAPMIIDNKVKGHAGDKNI